MTRYLLDTNIVSDLMRHPGDGRTASTLRQTGGWRAYTSIVVIAELRFGIAKIVSNRLAQRLQVILRELAVVPFAAPTDETYADIRARLERTGTPIGRNDLWIAAQALHDDSVLVTDNEREFARVPGLKIENWLRS